MMAVEISWKQMIGIGQYEAFAFNQMTRRRERFQVPPLRPWVEDDPNWQWSVEIDSDLSEGLLAVTVTVEEAGSQSESPISFRLHRWLRDPAMLEAMLDEEAAEGSVP